MDRLEQLVAKFSAQLETQVKKEVPVAFKLAVSNAISQLSGQVLPVKGHLRSGVLDYLLLRQNDGILVEGHEEDGTRNMYAAAGLFNCGDSEQLAAVVVHRNYWHYTFEVFVKKGDITGAAVILDVLNRHLTKDNPVKGKIINLMGDIRTLDDLDWDSVAIPQQFKTELERNILFPMKNYETLRKRGLYEAAGVLLAGEVGMGKSLLGRIVAKKVTELGGTVVMTTPHEIGSVPSPEWKYVFEVAGTLRPTLLYVEDVETSGAPGSSKMYQLAEYLDGLEDRKDVMLVVTTNELESLDRRLKERPGRIDRILVFDPKKPEFGTAWKEQVLAIHLNGNRGLEADPKEIVGLVGNRPYSGAQLAAIISTATKIVLNSNGLAQPYSPNGKVILDRHVIEEAIRVLDNTYNFRRTLGFSTNQQT
ncbi:ATP-binding protein [Candidatus Woesearchaeota archaeon]|nr:ATP-binding protein [Candidatus Woesearchaeota archaeon]